MQPGAYLTRSLFLTIQGFVTPSPPAVETEHESVYQYVGPATNMRPETRQTNKQHTQENMRSTPQSSPMSERLAKQCITKRRLGISTNVHNAKELLLLPAVGTAYYGGPSSGDPTSSPLVGVGDVGPDPVPLNIALRVNSLRLWRTRSTSSAPPVIFNFLPATNPVSSF